MVSKTFFEIEKDNTINQVIADVDRPAIRALTNAVSVLSRDRDPD